MTCAALVLFMTLPGLGSVLRRSGSAQKRSLRPRAMPRHRRAGHHSLVGCAATALSFMAEPARSSAIGLGHFCKGSIQPEHRLRRYWVSHNVFSMYQLMFAIITPALIIGAIAERMKFSAILLFVDALDVRRLFPARAHGLGHGRFDERRLESERENQSASTSPAARWFTCPPVGRALMLCMILGKRLGFGKEPMPPHSMVLCMVGTGMLWVGWYGFNAGQRLARTGSRPTPSRPRRSPLASRLSGRWLNG